MRGKTLLIGGKGYIGSRLETVFTNKKDIYVLDYPDNYAFVDRRFLSNFNTIILLAGHSSVKQCEGKMIESFENNVTNFLYLIDKIGSQKFIYASSSSVYGKTYGIVNEAYNISEPYNYYDITKKIIDTYITKTDIDYYGLRFGTVNGWSPNMRNDIMINSMVESAKKDGHVKLYIKDTKRPILGTKDLCRAITTIMRKENSERGIYNLASFNMTAEEIAYGVAKEMKVPVIEYKANEITNAKLQTSQYDFAIDSSKFERNFDFQFKDTLKKIVKSIKYGI